MQNIFFPQKKVFIKIQDFLIEKKKLVETQRIRVRDIVHSSFEAVNSLIPNPIKSAIRNTLKSEGNKENTESDKGLGEQIGSKIGGEIGKKVEEGAKGLVKKGLSFLK